MAMNPTSEQFTEFIEKAPAGPIRMLNLLKFKEKAVYKDGRKTDLTGRATYEKYMDEMTKMVEADGGKLVFGAETNVLVIGEGELEWDMVGVMEYSSLEGFQKILATPAYAEIHHHRDAGLAHQLLINIK
jgi:uncharacterized protein (DUF1330 family)